MSISSQRLPFHWSMGFPSLASNVSLVGTHHILDRDVSKQLEPLVDYSSTVVIEHPLFFGVSENIPLVMDCIQGSRLEAIKAILRELGWPDDIDRLRADEAVAFIQRAAYSSLGELFLMEKWVEQYARGAGKHVSYAETVEERDSAAVELYAAYLESLTTKDSLIGGIRASLDNYWKGVVELGSNEKKMDFFKSGVTSRSVAMLEHIVFELMRRENRAAVLLGTLHCLEIVEWLADPGSFTRTGSALSPKVLDRIRVERL